MPDKTLLFRRISKPPVDIKIMRALEHDPRAGSHPLKVGWPTMDTSNLAEHAGTAGTLFASVFVVATTTMRTMIPLRVFAILTNIVLIATAIPSRNYLFILVQAVVL